MMPAAPATATFTTQQVLSIHKRTASLVNFRTSRDAAFRFTPGHYARLGLGEAGAEVWRPYSIASSDKADYLDFQFTLVPGGAFTELFSQVKEGDAIRIDTRAFGFLTLDALAQGGTVWMFSTGTGLAPFISILMADKLWQQHGRVILMHSVRHAGELMGDVIESAMATRSGEERARFTYLPVVTREPAEGALHARINELFKSGELEKIAGEPIDAEHARAMLCGNPEMIKELRAMLKERGMGPLRRGVPGQLAAEGYW